MHAPLYYKRRTFRRASMVLPLLACAAVSLAIAAQAPLMLVSTAWPPFTNRRPAKVCARPRRGWPRPHRSHRTDHARRPAHFTSRCFPAFDGSAAVWKDPERERVLLFSQAYLENRLVLIGRTGADVSAKTMADLRGKRVAIVEGYSYGDAVDHGPDLRPLAQRRRQPRALLKSEVDYTLMDDLVVQHIVNDYPKESGAGCESARRR